MAVQPGFRPVDNMTRQGPGLDVEYFQVGPNATAAKMLPGIAVIMDTTDNYVKEYGSSGGKVIGFLSYEKSPDKPKTIDTAFAVGDWVAVERGAGKRIRARLAASQTIVNGQELAVTTDGYLGAATVGTDDVIADAEQSVTTTTTTAAIWIITRK